MKRFLTILSLSVLFFTLVGCANENGSSTGGNEKTKITAWAWDPNFNIAALNEAKRIYEEQNQDIEIEIVEYAQADVIQKLNTALSSGSTVGLPNIVLIEDYRAQTFLQSYAGSFEDLSSITNSSKFANHKLETMKVDDKYYGVPFDNSAAVMYYRKDLIEKAGYNESDMIDLTWEEYIVMGDKIKEATGVDLLTLDPNDIGQIRMMMHSASTWYVKNDGKTPYFEDNDVLKYAVELYLKLLESGNAKVISEWSQFVGAPNNSEVATVPTGCWFTPSIAQAKDQEGLWGVAPFPRMEKIENSVNASNLGGSSFYVLNGVKGSDKAIDFLDKTFGGSMDLYQNILDNNNIIATYLPSNDGESYLKEVKFFDNQKIYSDIQDWSKDIPSINYGLHTYASEDILKAGLQNIIAGSTIDEELSKMQKQAEAQFN